MKCFFTPGIFCLIVSQFLFINIANSQEISNLAGNNIKGLHSCIKRNESGETIKYSGLSKNKNGFRLFKSAGIKLIFSTNEYGWHHPFPFISRNFHDDPGLGTGGAGIYLEGLSNNNFSTIIDAVFLGRSLNIEYDLYDGNGNVINTDKAKSTFKFISFRISEKFKLTKYTDESEFNIYFFAGLHYNIITSSDIDSQLVNYISGFSTNVTGLNSGFGLSIGKKYRVSLDFYYAPDLSRTYSTESGYYKNTEFGVVIGVGYNKF